MVMPQRPIMPPSRPNIPPKASSSTPSFGLNSKPTNLNSQQKPNQGPYSYSFDGKERDSVFNFKRNFNREFKIGQQYKGTRAEDFSREDKSRIEKIVFDSKISQDGVITKDEIVKKWDREIKPKLAKGIDPETGKYLNPYNYKDSLKIKDWKEVKSRLGKIIGKKLN